MSRETRTDNRARPAEGGQESTGSPGFALARLVGSRRARILEALRTAKTTGEAAAAADIAASTASEHLRDLVLARVVERFRSGRFVYYVLSSTGEWLVDALADQPSTPPG